jgi:hypothetical protein
MEQTPTPPSSPRSWRRWIKPAAAAGAGGASLLLFFEELLIIAVDWMGVIVLTLMSGLIYILNHFFFKSAMPDANRHKK